MSWPGERRLEMVAGDRVETIDETFGRVVRIEGQQVTVDLDSGERVTLANNRVWPAPSPEEIRELCESLPTRAERAPRVQPVEVSRASERSLHRGRVWRGSS